jgi:ribosomal protein S18 acetylase RimI-like enzyme
MTIDLSPSPPRASPSDSTPAASSGWVPVRSLDSHHRGHISDHLLQLAPADRYLRFGYAATDAQLARYVDALDFERDELFGIFNRRLALIAMAHLAYPPRDDAKPVDTSAEFGVSVLLKARGRGFGRRLFDHATLHARNRGVDTLLIHALSENAAMLKIARNAGATVKRYGPESQAWLALPEETIGSHVGAAASRQAAEIDYRFKAGAVHVNDWIEAIDEIRTGVGVSGVARE